MSRRRMGELRAYSEVLNVELTRGRTKASAPTPTPTSTPKSKSTAPLTSCSLVAFLVVVFAMLASSL
jgi:hypothetical protein